MMQQLPFPPTADQQWFFYEFQFTKLSDEAVVYLCWFWMSEEFITASGADATALLAYYHTVCERRMRVVVGPDPMRTELFRTKAVIDRMRLGMKAEGERETMPWPQ